MADNKRSYRPIRVDMIGVENGSKRFTKEGVTSMPPVARWRNNLTAMSQHDNLFCCASGDCIAVYQPKFPYQTLDRHPALLIKPELANQYAAGYMSHHRTTAEEHYINHLVTGELGTQEILLLATDSGNIEAYYTSSILRAIERIQRTGQESGYADTVGLRPFFKHWVRQSAWGLDIHKDARMIAVSSNVPSHLQPADDQYSDETSATITVFAFALTHLSPESQEDRGEDDEEDILDAEWATWTTSQNIERPERGRNFKVLLNGPDGHDHNIPNIAFINTFEDTGGAWLLSTDITGIMKLWQIWRGSCVRQWDFSNEDNGIGAWMQASYPGWNVAALDISIFRPVTTNAEFIGADRAPIHYGYHDQGPSYNVTSIARQIPENSRFHPSHLLPADDDDAGHTDQIFNDQGFDDELASDDGNNSDSVQRNPFMLPSASDVQQITTDRSDPVAPEDIDLPLEFVFEQENDDSDYFSDVDESDEEDESFTLEEEAITPPSPPANRRIGQLRAKVRPYQFPDVAVPQVAMIHCSNTHIRMLGSPKARYPHIFCANIVRQAMPEHILNIREGHELQMMDRLNMVQKIPELGILLVATQAGRVAVCSLTRKGDLFGFRVDWVLPTKRQEQAGQRPSLCTLLGMAVAPIQGRWKSCHDASEEDEGMVYNDGIIDGVKTTFEQNVVVLGNGPVSRHRHAKRTEDSPEPRLERRSWKEVIEEVPSWQAVEHHTRYRIMLTYSDLSVLTYEISQNVESVSDID